jgi:hypothetical protein
MGMLVVFVLTGLIAWAVASAVAKRDPAYAVAVRAKPGHPFAGMSALLLSGMWTYLICGWARMDYPSNVGRCG